MTRYATILAFCISLTAFSVSADVVHSTDFEADGAAQGAGFGFGPQSMNFSGGGGDHVGIDGLGLSTANPASGSYSYAIDSGATADNGNGWGGTWTGITSIDAGSSGGFTSAADAIANGGNYVTYTPGATFTVSAGMATDSADPLTGSGNGAVRLEFYYSIDTDGDGIGDASTEIASVLPRAGGNGFDASSLTTAYQTSTATYTLTAADVDFANIAAPNAGETVVGIDRVAAVMGTDGHGNGGTDGLVFYDDFLFEVNAENVVNVVPEPGSISLLLAGFLSLCGLVRRKRN